MYTRLCYPGGSSPRMQGALINRQTGEIEDGIIPADAGSTHMSIKGNRIA